MLAEKTKQNKTVIPKATLDNNSRDESFSSYFLGKNCLMTEIFSQLFDVQF